MSKRLLLGILLMLIYSAWTTGAYAKTSATFAYFSGNLSEIKNECQIGFRLWADELSRTTPVQFDVQPVDSIPALLQRIQAQKVDFLLINTFHFLQLQHQLAAYLGADIWAIQRSNSLFERYVIFTRKGVKSTDFGGLSGLRLSLRGDYPLMHDYLRLLTYQAAKLEPERFFKTIKPLMSLSQPVLDVFFANADVGIAPQFAYDLAIELNPGMLSKLQIIHTSPAYFIPILVLSFKHASPETQTIFKNSMQLMQTTPRGKQIFEWFKIHSVRAISFQELQPLMRFNEQIRQLKRVKAAKKYASQTAK